MKRYVKEKSEHQDMTINKSFAERKRRLLND